MVVFCKRSDSPNIHAVNYSLKEEEDTKESLVFLIHSLCCVNLTGNSGSNCFRLFFPRSKTVKPPCEKTIWPDKWSIGSGFFNSHVTLVSL